MAGRLFRIVGCCALFLLTIAIGLTMTHTQVYAQDSGVYLPFVLQGGGSVASEEPSETSDTPGKLDTETPTSPAVCLSGEEMELASRINDYRQANGLAEIPLSVSLTQVAHAHVVDLHDNHPDTGTDSRGIECNMHSWSDEGNWTPVCYTPDHEYATGMWSKPAEITDGAYPGSGFEISHRYNSGASASTAIDAWQGSDAHNAVMLETGVWEATNWPAMGVGIYEEYAVVWFGDVTDPEGTVVACP